jgi:sugar/nucleoside kinase (ribokinase family)
MLLVLGDALLDITIAPEGALVPGADLLGKIVMGPGGSAANFAYWAARLGEQVTLIAPVGQDLPGQLVRAHLDAAHVRLISDHTGATGMVAAVIGAAGERTLITQLDPSAQTASARIDPEEFAQTHWLHISGYALLQKVNLAGALHAATRARAAGARISVDLCPPERWPVPTLWPQLEQMKPDLLFADQREARALAPGLNPLEAAGALLKLAPTVALKLGAGGCIVADPSGTTQHPGQPSAPVDATGAGDAFAAGFVVHWQRWGRAADAGSFANRLAARVVSDLGARPAVGLTDLQQELGAG